jgi:hypothetical protein
LLQSLAYAQDATWLVNPPNNNWDNAANWSPSLVPTGTAIFGASAITSLMFSEESTSIGTIQFNASAPAYTFNIDSAKLNITGAGIVNASSFAPTFALNGGTTAFFNASSAGSATILNNAGRIEFHDASTAENALITNQAGGGAIFSEASTAGNATIRNVSGFTDFEQSSKAGNSTIFVSDSSNIRFFDSSSAQNATINIFGNPDGCRIAGRMNCGVAFFAGVQTTAANAIINNSGVMFFFGTAGNATITNNSAIIFGSNSTANVFINGSTAGSATINNTGSALLGSGGADQTGLSQDAPVAGISVLFQGISTAANATIINGGTPASNAVTAFQAFASAGNAIIVNNSSGSTLFLDTSTAANSTVITNAGGKVSFLKGSSGGQARFITAAGGVFDMSGLTSSGMTAGISQLPQPAAVVCISEMAKKNELRNTTCSAMSLSDHFLSSGISSPIFM